MRKPDQRSAEAKQHRKLYSYRWQQYRLRFLAANPLCIMCQKEGRITAATVVDHIKPHKGNHTLFWDPKNHQPLCTAHHNSDKQAQERSGRAKRSVALDGWPEDE